MCYQNFVYYICGHGTVDFEETCDFVTHPFTQRIHCPDYSSSSSPSNYACSGGFYCAKSKDANYLDDLRKQRNNHSSNHEEIVAQLKSDKHTLEIMVKSAEFMKVPQEKLKQHKTYQAVRSNIIALVPQMNALRPQIIQLHNAFEEVQRFYSSFGGLNSPNTNWSKAPSFVETQGRRIFTNTAITATSVDVSNPAPTGQLPEGDNIIVTPGQAGQASQHYGDGKKDPARESSGLKVTKPRGRARRVINQETTIKPGRKSASPAKPAPHQESSNVRRSARVVKKQINYMESDGSSPSRAVSPEDSDVSGFAPSNSDISESPDKSKQKRGRPSLRTQGSGLSGTSPSRSNNSLVDKLSDFQGFMRRRSPLRDSIVQYESPSLQPRIPERSSGLKPLLPAPSTFQSESSAPAYGDPSNSNPSSRPPTRHGIPNQPQSINPGNTTLAHQPPAMPDFLSSQSGQTLPPANQTALQNGYQATSTNCPPYYGPANTNANGHQANANWLMNTPTDHSADPTNRYQPLSTPYPPTQSVQRTDSFTSQTTPFNPTTKVETARPDYEHMRRSFSAAADLTPPATTPIPTSTDPKKRKLPASSPLQSSGKRLRLSFPSDQQNEAVYAPPSVYTQGFSMSSPSKIPSQSTSFESNPGQQQALEQTESPPTPAPVFAPTAFMYDTSQYQVHPETGSAVQEMSLQDTTNECYDYVGAMNNEGDIFSDVSWDELDFDPLSEFFA